MTFDDLSSRWRQYRPLLIGILMGSLLLWPRLALGQMKVSPLVIETQARRNQAQGVVSVTNVGDTILRVRVYAEPFTYTDTGFQSLASGAVTGDLTPYLQFSPAELVIPPGAVRRIRLITRFPPGVADGEYRAMIFAEKLANPDETPNSEVGTVEAETPLITINVRIGSAFYVRQGDVSSNLSVLGASWNSTQQNPQLLLANTGLASERVSVDWQLKRDGAEIARGSLSSATVITQSQRQLQLRPDSPLPNPLPAGDYQLTGEARWEEGRRLQQLPFSLLVTIPGTSSP